MKLGKLPPKHDVRTLRFANYLRRKLPAPALEQHWESGISGWGMMLNDKLGDCTIAGAGHLIKLWSANIGNEIVVPDNDILTAYEAVSGYNPSNGTNDNGAYELDVLNYWRKNGIGGQKISAFVSIDTTNFDYVKWAIMLFGGAYVGLALPKSAEYQQTWQVISGPDAEPGSWGGHCVPLVGYDSQYVECITWGGIMKMTWEFWLKYGDEAYAILSPNWLKDGLDPNLISVDVLTQDLQVVSG